MIGASRPSIPAAAFDYDLPAHRIAQVPLRGRDESRLLLVAGDGTLADHRFTDLPALLQPGDVCVVNETRVRAARLRGRLEDGAAAELLVVERLDPTSPEYACLARPARRLVEGARLRCDGGLEAVVVGRGAGHPGERVLRFSAASEVVEAAIERAGEAPLPPYVRQALDEPERYQTVYAAGPARSAAAPTAGLHFSERVIQALRARGVGWTAVRLDVGIATFAPMRVDDVSAHPMHAERFSVPDETARAVAGARARGGRVVAVGTTTVRALESCADEAGTIRAREGATTLFIVPGYRFRAVDALLTNFHQPRSSLLALLAAFIGMDRWRQAYAHALAGGYRFLSLGDCMLCWAPTAA